MAQAYIYRAAYVQSTVEGSDVHFSGWVTGDGIDEAEARLLAAYAGGEGTPPADPPIIIGWEKLELDTEPV